MDPLISLDSSSAGAETKIEIRGIQKVYKVKRESGGGYDDFVVLRDVDLDVYAGEFLTLVGPSGCGKSTLLDLLAGLIPNSGGEIRIDGRIIDGPAMDRGFVMQAYALFPWLTVQANVEFGLTIKKVPKKERREISSHFLELVGLTSFANRYPHELSGGMKQRVAIARALAFDPAVLLMDEPFAALDAQTRETLQDELLDLWEKTKKTIVFVTHSIDEAVYLADRIAVMGTNPGRVTELVNIKLARPRKGSRGSAEFGWIRRRIWQFLQRLEVPEEDLELAPNAPSVAEVIDSRVAL
ncbi:MAG: ABC transporter ATP-binding protein [Deltaproteobacteria bacterium]|jgi:NitT/TauT family transport system ATP-binding protein|nr:ABC transporter ATP-binding protein [Deltaproteobacteria bacterium]